MAKKPGNHLAVNQARGRLLDGLQALESEVVNRGLSRHIDTARIACHLLLADMIRIQGWETLETRALEERIAIFTRTAEEMAPRGPVKARPRLSLIPGGLR